MMSADIYPSGRMRAENSRANQRRIIPPNLDRSADQVGGRRQVDDAWDLRRGLLTPSTVSPRNRALIATGILHLTNPWL